MNTTIILDSVSLYSPYLSGIYYVNQIGLPNAGIKSMVHHTQQSYILFKNILKLLILIFYC